MVFEIWNVSSKSPYLQKLIHLESCCMQLQYRLSCIFKTGCHYTLTTDGVRLNSNDLLTGSQPFYNPARGNSEIL